MAAKLFQMSGSSHAFYFCSNTGVVHCFFLVSHHQLVADRPGFYCSCPLSWCGVRLTSQEGKATSTELVLLLTGANQARTDSDLAQTSVLFCHTLALGSGELGSGKGTGWLRYTFESWKLKPDSESPVILAWLVVCEWLNVPSSPFHSSSK